jgi:hypothetical protein
VLVDDVDEVDAAVVVLEIPVVVVATPDSAAPPCLTFMVPTLAKFVGLGQIGLVQYASQMYPVKEVPTGMLAVGISPAAV